MHETKEGSSTETKDFFALYPKLFSQTDGPVELNLVYNSFINNYQKLEDSATLEFIAKVRSEIDVYQLTYSDQASMEAARQYFDLHVAPLIPDAYPTFKEKVDALKGDVTKVIRFATNIKCNHNSGHYEVLGLNDPMTLMHFASKYQNQLPRDYELGHLAILPYAKVPLGAVA